MPYGYVPQLWALLLLHATVLQGTPSKELRQVPATKRFINRFDEGDFEFVYPQLRERSEKKDVDTRNYHSKNGLTHLKHTTIVIRTSFFGRLKLILNLNEFLFVNETEFKKYGAEGEGLLSERVENCYYQGTVNGSASSFVALSSCDGLRGVISLGNGTSYGIWPLEGREHGGRRRGDNRRTHVLYKTTWSRETFCGTRVAESLRHSTKAIRKRDVTGRTKYFELAVIGDKSFMAHHELSEKRGIMFMLEAVNIADYMFFRSMNVRLSVVYTQQWMNSQRIGIHKDIETTLSEAVAYVTDPMYQITKDASVFLTGETFANSEVVSSTFGSACTSRATTIVTAVDTYTVHDTAAILAHGLAHVLGISHDDSNCECNHGEQCGMQKQLGVPKSAFSWEFSKCSIERLHSNLQLGLLQCLLNKPRQESSLQLCGNGIVDDDEECDCGPRDKCTDDCCDPLTCTLRSDAECASHQACCKECKVLPKGFVCRLQRSACDIREECDGESGECPVDGYLTDGTSCGLNGQCWKGNCSDPESQCKSFWGSDSSVAEQPCFERNVIGTDAGNCGVDGRNLFKKCAQKDVRCGFLHCQGGASSPIKEGFNSQTNIFYHAGKKIECKTVNHTVVGLVPDGASCGLEKVCVNGACLPLADVSPQVSCPTNNHAFPCSGHGHCTTSQRCVCFDGWTGIDCSTRHNISRRLLFTTTLADEILIPSFTAGRTLNTTTLLAILLFVGIVLLMLLVCLLFCYRRRSVSEFPDGPLDEKLSESIPENNDRAIKFGNMPSYREEKRKRKKNKRVYDALHRINEASDERDSVSVKSRESGEKNSAIGSANGSAVGCAEPVVGYGIEDDRVFNRIVNGSSSSILKNGNVSRRLFHDGEIYSRSPCSEILGSPSRYSAMGRNGLRYERNRSGYATDTELGSSPYAPRYVEALSMTRVDISPSASETAMVRLAPTPLKLNNIGKLLRQLHYNDDITSEADLSTTEGDKLDCMDLGSNTESSRGFEIQDPAKLSSSGELPEVCDIRVGSPISAGMRRSPGTSEGSGMRTQPESQIVPNDSWSGMEPSSDSEFRSDSRIKYLSMNGPQANNNTTQSPSLFSDPFRLEV